MPLNKDQQAAAESLRQFLHSNDREIMISGAAGTGKTYLMNYFNSFILPEYQKSLDLLGLEKPEYYVYYTATTNKAAAILYNSVSSTISTTIHRALGLKVKENHKTGETSLQLEALPLVQAIGFPIVIIDECSMISSELLHYIDIIIPPNSKIIYLGDKYQLPPVGEKVSPVYARAKSIIELTEQMRNSNSPPLMKLCSQLRNSVITHKIENFDQVPGSIEFLNDDQSISYFQKNYQTDNLNYKTLAYTNRSVDSYNQLIRNMRQLPSTYTPGEVIVCSAVSGKSASKLKVEKAFTIQETIQSKVAPRFHNIPYYLILLKDNSTGKLFQVPIPFSSKDLYAKLKSHSNQRDWQLYFDLKAFFSEFKPYSATTIHKSQGSTYDEVFLDLSDLSKARDPETIARLFYVAASRAKNKLLLRGYL